MTIKTSKGATYDADIVMELHSDRSLLVQLRDPGKTPLSKLARAFEGLSSIMCEDGRGFTEYTDLRILTRLSADTIQLRLYKEDD